MSLGAGGLLGTVELPFGLVVLLGVVVLPGSHGAPATVAEVPLGEADAVVVVELVVPVLEVADVLPDEGVVFAVVDGLPLLEGVHGATVVEVPVCVCVEPVVPPVTDPALPATPGVPCVADGLPLVVLPGWLVCNVPIEPDDPVVEGVPVVVDGVPVWVDVVVPGCVPVVLWLVPMPVLGVAGLGVTEPVLCAMAIPTDNANTDVASKILRIKSCSLCSCVSGMTDTRAMKTPETRNPTTSQSSWLNPWNQAPKNRPRRGFVHLLMHWLLARC
jgi:hypothetical protein